MSTMAAVVAEHTGARRRPNPRRASGARSRVRHRPWAREGTVLFAVSFALYIAAAAYVVLHLHLMNTDAYSRVVNAWNVLYSRDPHLAAMGVTWPPLPSFLDLPVLLLKGWFPALVTDAFAGSIVGAGFSAGTVVLINGALRRAGVSRVRWLLLAAWIANPMTAWYGLQGMSEPLYIFFTVATILCFLRWSETGSHSMLFVMGASIGLGTLVRSETIIIAAALAGAIAVRSLWRRTSLREVETELLLYGMPVVFCMAIFVGANWAIKGDPLYFAHGNYSNAAQAAVAGGFGGAAIGHWSLAGSLTAHAAVALFPAVLPLMALLLLRSLFIANRVTGLLLVALALPVYLGDIVLLHAGQFGPLLRYFIYVIPYAFAVVVYLLGELRRVCPGLLPSGVVALALVLGGSDLLTARTMSDPALAPEEKGVISAVLGDRPARAISADGRDVALGVARVDVDHRLVGMDAFTGYRVVVNAPDPSTYVITSDEDFEAALAQPVEYHVGYFLVPQPKGVAALDRIDQLYPTLWASGGGFATLAASVGHGWRLYRIDHDPVNVQ